MVTNKNGAKKQLIDIKTKQSVKTKGGTKMDAEYSEEYEFIDFERGAFQSPGKQTWLEAPIRLMLTLLEDLMPKVGKSAYLKNEKKLWQIISENLEQNGYLFSPEQVEGKFRAMERQYKKCKLNNSQTGRNRLSCPYETELENILGNKKSINPDYVLDSEFIVGKANEEKNELSDDSDTPSPSKADVNKIKGTYKTLTAAIIIRFPLLL
ncbi:uncharacterized protein [Musca autumnalis]|uniref:uncharacterized protein n=1 Tax=Musca autumnalis TaxID=221902 RepID=UPI003CFB9316